MIGGSCLVSYFSNEKAGLNFIVEARKMVERFLDPNIRVCFLDENIQFLENIQAKAFENGGFGISETDFKILKMLEEVVENILWK